MIWLESLMGFVFFFGCVVSAGDLSMYCSSKCKRH
jgi:hypothetical protein